MLRSTYFVGRGRVLVGGVLCTLLRTHVRVLSAQGHVSKRCPISVQYVHVVFVL